MLLSNYVTQICFDLQEDFIIDQMALTDIIIALTIDDKHFSSNVIGNEGIWEELKECLQSATDSCLAVTQAVDV